MADDQLTEALRYKTTITDRYSKLVRTIPLAKITAIEVAEAFVHHWVFVYGPPVSLLSDNGKTISPQSFSTTPASF